MAYKRFGPVWTPQSHTLIVGTWPSPESRRQNFYYGHPRNRFWPLLAALLGTAVPCTVEEKTALVCVHGLALWDTVQQCTFTGGRPSSASAHFAQVAPSGASAPAKHSGRDR